MPVADDRWLRDLLDETMRHLQRNDSDTFTMGVMIMSDAAAQPPLNPEPPAPPGQDIEAPDLQVETPDEGDTPDGTAVSPTAGTEEAPD